MDLELTSISENPANSNSNSMGFVDAEKLAEDIAKAAQYELLTSYKQQYDLLIQDLQDRLSHEEDAHAALNQTKKKLEGEIAHQKKEIEDLELSLQKVTIL